MASGRHGSGPPRARSPPRRERPGPLGPHRLGHQDVDGEGVPRTGGRLVGHRGDLRPHRSRCVVACRRPPSHRSLSGRRLYGAERHVSVQGDRVRVRRRRRSERAADTRREHDRLPRRWSARWVEHRLFGPPSTLATAVARRAPRRGRVDRSGRSRQIDSLRTGRTGGVGDSDRRCRTRPRRCARRRPRPTVPGSAGRRGGDGRVRGRWCRRGRQCDAGGHVLQPGRAR